MTDPTPSTAHPRPISRFHAALSRRFSLRDDKASDEEIERRIRDGVELRGATPWILMFAILVASVGLNVNSTAVIIGAMLISPLMGPIMGAGLGIAVYDFDLVKRSLSNLGIATVISLLVSAFYFALSPLHEAQSELLARTSPTIWDVLIALFGGLAGIVGTTREEKSNVIPGVAIATALMPPVCTAGFGLASGQWAFVGGALYLYTINCVFISIATIIGIRVMRLKRHGFADAAIERRVKVSLLLIALCTALPSAYLAMKLVQDEIYKSRARGFVDQEFAFDTTHVAETRINPRAHTIELAMIGNRLDDATLNNIQGRLALAHLDGTRIIVHQAGDEKVDVTALKSSLISDLYKETLVALEKKDAELNTLHAQLATRDATIGLATDIQKELAVQYPGITSVFVGEGVELPIEGSAHKRLQLIVTADRAIASDDQERIIRYFKARTKTDDVMAHFEMPPERRPATTAKPHKIGNQRRG